MHDDKSPCAAEDSWASRVIWLLVFLLTVYSVWAWAGLRPSLHQYTFYASFALGALLVLVGPGSVRLAIFRDPVFWLGLLFNAYLVLQWSNAGRELYLDSALNEWRYSDPPRPGWPFAFDADEAWQMITWFVPAWLLVTAVRSPHFNAASGRRLLVGLVISAGLLGFFGLIQYFSGTDKVFWITPFSAGFYASFAYRNHAGSFFVMMSLVGAALLFRYVFFAEGKRVWPVVIPLLLSIGLCLVSLIFCGSRAAVFFFGISSAIIMVTGLVLSWRRGTRVQRLHTVAIIIMAVCLVIPVVRSYGLEVIRREFAPKKTATTSEAPIDNSDKKISLNMSPELRVMLAKSAWGMWKDHMWYGVGGWGFKYKAAYYTPADKWNELRKGGRANVHLDALQFLAEFGLAGFIPLLLLIFILSAAAWRKTSYDQRVLARLVIIGLALVVVHSVIDLPFRSPGITYHWLILFALIPNFSANHILTRNTDKT